MYTRLSQFMQALIEQERTALDNHAVKHGPTIGAMYEGLTSEALRMVLPQALYVSSGFVLDSNGGRSPQMDVVVSTSQGVEIPYTGTFDHQIEDVVAVIEVKKRAYSNDILDAWDKLVAVAKLESNSSVSIESIERRFSLLTGFPLPTEHQSLSWPYSSIFRILVREALLPARIMLGYDGFKTEEGIRGAVFKCVEHSTSREDPFELVQYPNLLISPRTAVCKGVAAPWYYKINDIGWAFLSSCGNRPMVGVLLDALLSKIGAPIHVYDADTHKEAWSRLIDLKPGPDGRGWHCYYRDLADPNLRTPSAYSSPKDDLPWTPFVVDEGTATTALVLSQRGILKASATPKGVSEAEYLRHLQVLNQAGVAGPSLNDRDIWKPMVSSFVICMLPDGRSVIAPQNDTYLWNWMSSQVLDSVEE